MLDEIDIARLVISPLCSSDRSRTKERWFDELHIVEKLNRYADSRAYLISGGSVDIRTD